MTENHHRRYFTNRLRDLEQFDQHFLKNDSLQLNDKWRGRLEKRIDRLFDEWHTAIHSKAIGPSSSFDPSIYTGIAGYAWLCMRMAEKRGRGDLLNEADRLLHISREKKSDRISFLCGPPGVMVLEMELCRLKGEPVKDSLKQSLIDMKRMAMNNDSNELLYGRAGYLYALSRAYRLLSDGDQELFSAIQQAIIEDGRRSKKSRGPFSLNWQWHGKCYFGAAHGICGILFCLMDSPGFDVDSGMGNLIRETIDQLIAQRFPSQNLPSSLGNDSDRLVQWCHGAPGLIHCLAKAHELFKKDHYLTAMEQCAEVVWERGLLVKGYGLCHGTSGSVYALLDVFRCTKKHVYLHRALSMAEWMFDYGNHGCRIPDRPHSMFEGTAGLLYLFIDLLDPIKARFPGLY